MIRDAGPAAPAPGVFIYSVYGLTLRSAFAIPGLQAGAAQADVVISEGDVPEHLPARRSAGMAFEASHGNYLLTIPGVARYWARDGSEIIMAIAEHARMEDVCSFLLGAVMTAVLHQRGALVLHGAAVAGPAGAVVLAGHSGHGKSTLAAALERRGYGVLADDVAALLVDPGDRLNVQCGPQRVDLWSDAMTWLDHEVSEARRKRPGVGKYSVPTRVSPEAALMHVFVLATHNGQGIERTPLTGSARFDAIREHTRNFRMLEGLGTLAEHLKLAARVASTVPVTHLRRPSGENSLGFLTDLVGEVLG